MFIEVHPVLTDKNVVIKHVILFKQTCSDAIKLVSSPHRIDYKLNVLYIVFNNICSNVIFDN